jgi:ArsR family transcriptional regulator, arsenate/arsenite/antimonite-responsive transcriptional repressor
LKLLTGTFKALSDETRLQIMTLLLENDELCVCDFVGALGQTQSKISRHLRYLYNTGVVEDRRDGLWMHYRLSSSLEPEQAAIVETLAKIISDEKKAELREALRGWLGSKAADTCGQEATACC